MDEFIGFSIGDQKGQMEFLEYLIGLYGRAGFKVRTGNLKVDFPVHYFSKPCDRETRLKGCTFRLLHSLQQRLTGGIIRKLF